MRSLGSRFLWHWVPATVTGLTMLLTGILLLSGSLVLTSLASVVGHFEGTGALPAECGIVFGAAVRPVYDGNGNLVSAGVGPGIDRRVSTASELYRQGLIQKLFVSGGTGEGMRQSEAFVMRRLAVAQGVDPRHVITEGESHSTEENLRNTRALAEECSSIVAISDRYHLARIAFLGRMMEWNIGTVPAERTATRVFEARSVLRESLILSVLTLEYLLT